MLANNIQGGRDWCESLSMWGNFPRAHGCPFPVLASKPAGYFSGVGGRQCERWPAYANAPYRLQQALPCSCYPQEGQHLRDKQYVKRARTSRASRTRRWRCTLTLPPQRVTFEGHTGNVTSVCFHSEGKWLVTGSEDGTIKIWDLR